MSVEQRLPTLQWLLENGQNIVARNLFATQITSENKYLPSFVVDVYSINEGGAEELVLTSSTVRSGNCPTWSICGLQSTSLLDKHYFSSKIVIRVFSLLRPPSSPSPSSSSSSPSPESEQRVLVTEEGFDLTRLMVYRVAGTLSAMVFPINTVLLSIGDEFFSSSRQSPMSASADSTDFSPPYLRVTAENTRSHHLADEAELSTFKQRLEHVTARTQERQDRQDSEQSATSEEEKRRKEASDAEALKHYIEERKKQLMALRQARERGEREEAYYKEKLETLRERTENYDVSAKKQQQIIATTKQEIKQKSEQLLKVKFSIEAKQIKLLYELHEIFPIEVRKNECLIRDIEIPNDLSAPAKDDEAVASGLGYVVHLLLLCSKYLEIPLRYQLLYMGSRSLVRDLIRDSSKDPVATYPLFKRGVEKERFEKAVTWLKGNVEFLLRCRGIEYDNSKHFLSNLQLLFDCDSCAKAKV